MALYEVEEDELIPEVWKRPRKAYMLVGAYGRRDVMIIKSSELLEGPEVVSRKRGKLTDSDIDSLDSQGISYKEDDVELMKERYCKSKSFTCVDVMEDVKSVKSVIDRISGLFNNSENSGVLIHYIGPGRRNTGDWCFKDGFLTFLDLMACYKQFLTHRTLELVSDCSYSGRWITCLEEFLDKEGVQPCGHSARATGIQIHLAVSCNAHEIPYQLYFSAKACNNDKNTKELSITAKKVDCNQHPDVLIGTELNCNAESFDASCLLAKDFTYQKLRYLKGYHYFINNKESLALLFLKFLFVGPPRLGKSTTLRRLMGKIADLQSAGEEEQEYPSTGAVEAGAVLVRSVSNTTAVITQSEWSAVESIEDEASMLLHNLINTLTSPSNAGATSSSAEVHTHSLSTVSVAETTSSLNTHSLSTVSVAETTSSQPTSQSAAEMGQIVQQLTPAPPAAQVTGQTQVSASSQDISEVVAMFQKAMGSSYWNDVKKMFKAYLRVEDTGGQPELMDMLPALTIGPGLYLLFINLQNDLDYHYKLTYCDKSGTCTHPVESIYNVKEMLFSSLASIWCSSASSSRSVLAKNKGIIPEVSDILKTSKSKAYIVGTHKDKVTEDHIKELNEQLQKIVESTEFGDLVEYFSEDELIVAVDNMAGGVEEVKKVQALLERCMSRCFTELRVPVVWLLLSLILRTKEKRTVSLEDCMHLSEALGMSCHETEVALWFLHHHAGVLMYFPNIPELKGLIIIDIQIVYDSVTILILKAMSWEEAGVHKARKFRKTGKFTIGELTAITSRACGDFIPIHKLVVLLKYLHIIAPISPHQQISSSSEEVTYIMPCVLDSANKEELDTISNKPHDVCPIMVCFKCGFVPIGIFPAMIACLINNQAFRVKENGIKKNVVQFALDFIAY